MRGKWPDGLEIRLPDRQKQLRHGRHYPGCLTFFTQFSDTLAGEGDSMARTRKQNSMKDIVEIQHDQEQTLVGELQILSATGELFNHVDEGLPMWASHGDRSVRVDVVFRTPFKASPVVTLGLTGIDSAHDQNLRFWLAARNVTPTGFTIECNTWDDTHIARAAISWHAIGAADPAA